MKTIAARILLSGIGFLLSFVPLFGQSVTDSLPKKATHTYPEIKGYVGLVHPLYTWSGDGNTQNFKDYYVVGNPWGINIWKSEKFGFSFELTPFVKSDSKDTKMSNFLFHPGVLYRLGHDFTFIFRAAYETSGRFGFTPIINKVVKRYDNSNIFVAILLPARYGNTLTPSYTVSFQFGVGF